MPTPHHRATATLLATLALAAAWASPAAAAGDVPERPSNLIHIAPGAEVSAPGVGDITSLMTGLNNAHEEKVGVLITDADRDAQEMANEVLGAWGLERNGAALVIATKDKGVGLAVGEDLMGRVSPADQADVMAKVQEGIGGFDEWASGVQRGGTRLFLYIEDQGLGGGTDDHFHSHGEGDVHAEGQDGAVDTPGPVADPIDGPQPWLDNSAKIGLGSFVALGSIFGLFHLVKAARRKGGTSSAGD